MNGEKGIPINEIASCSICPMKVYLSKSDTKFKEPLSYSVAKQVSYHLGDVLDIEKIWDELELTVPNCESDAREILESIVEACNKVTWRRAEDYDVSVRSERYNIYGRVDRLFDDSFSIVKPGKAPTNGVYISNRVQAACYAICLEEMFKKEMYGRVEYLGSGTIRSAVLSASDRRAFLLALDAAEKISRGEIPKAIHGTHCINCKFKETCSTSRKPKSLFERLRS
ncbi:MAG: Dna2/Cas4 domain-containing protein [Methanocorpusculum sp.]|nr:Dna2/Cas4 domain-containing protein [Methanocorpusculum sp.]